MNRLKTLALLMAYRLLAVRNQVGETGESRPAARVAGRSRTRLFEVFSILCHKPAA
jgi:hypothetical protein